MSDPKPPSSSESFSSVMQSLIQNLPAYMQVANSQLGPQAQAQLGAAQATSPGYSELLTNLYKQYAPQLARTGVDAASAADLGSITGTGGEVARRTQQLDRQLNPEYYATRSAQADKLGQLLGSINLNNANPEAERLVNQENIRSGNINNPTATGTVSNALSFGNEFQKRRDALGAAINTASGFLQPSAGNFNTAQIALNRPAGASGVSQFAGIQKPGDQAFQAGANLLSSGTALKQQQIDVNANRRDIIDRINEGFSAI